MSTKITKIGITTNKISGRQQFSDNIIFIVQGAKSG
jgi:hypothetical protein